MLVCLFGYILSKPLPKVLGGGDEAANQTPQDTADKQVNQEVVEHVSEKAVNPSRGVSDSPQSHIISGGVADVTELPGAYLSQFNRYYLNGYSKSGTEIQAVFTGYIGKDEYQFNSDLLANMGVTFHLIRDCVMQLSFKATFEYVFSEPKKVQNPLSADDKFTPPKIG